MSILKKSLIKISGNRFMQRVLERNVRALQDLMGIGSGDGVLASGERAIFHVLKQRLNPPYCLFDVGANKGQFLRLILDNIAVDDFSIHCFEPGKETFKILTESIRKDKRITLNNIGIGKEKGEAILHFDAPGSGLASLTKRRLDHFGIDFNNSEKVEINTIDDYCSENGIHRIHLLKLDIEGHELDAFSGAKRMFETSSIDMVTFEFGGCNIDTRTFFQDFWYFFNEVGMKLFRITPSGYLYPIESYKELHEQFTTTNFIALSN
ncbi:MAG: FkbM family methyltransferase [Desulfurivibrio sp.]|nr:FkbM family methyltransferase [Desulfurivibrio sp.]